jgi:hypothetical protein
VQVFEAERMYLHGARGAFGAIPLAVTGDMDLNAEAGGCYRLASPRSVPWGPFPPMLWNIKVKAACLAALAVGGSS